jgi:hypothetical protein
MLNTRTHIYILLTSMFECSFLIPRDLLNWKLWKWELKPSTPTNSGSNSGHSELWVWGLLWERARVGGSALTPMELPPEKHGQAKGRNNSILLLFWGWVCVGSCGNLGANMTIHPVLETPYPCRHMTTKEVGLFYLSHRLLQTVYGFVGSVTFLGKRKDIH